MKDGEYTHYLAKCVTGIDKLDESYASVNGLTDLKNIVEENKKKD